MTMRTMDHDARDDADHESRRKIREEMFDGLFVQILGPGVWGLRFSLILSALRLRIPQCFFGLKSADSLALRSGHVCKLSGNIGEVHPPEEPAVQGLP